VETTSQELTRNATAIGRRGGSAALNFRDVGHSVGVKTPTVHYYFPRISLLEGALLVSRLHAHKASLAAASE
jgi:AcrR family transcriptional regulator